MSAAFDLGSARGRPGVGYHLIAGFFIAREMLKPLKLTWKLVDFKYEDVVLFAATDPTSSNLRHEA
jgi:hypothetical protein